jgi:hypothetical protein
MTSSEHKGTKGRKPEGNLEGVKVAQGLEKEPRSQGEVSGHASGGYVCWNCGALNWVPPGWHYFYCWNCGGLNWI